ncbi:MAG: glycosyltransferase family 4 protein [Nitrospirota bacterium]|nr:glycosyltransferase family 4 protein [Nitrospirota bacterium]
MKVAIIKSNYTPFGGGEKYTTRLIRAFAARGDSVDVLTAVKGEWDAFDNNVRWVRLRQIPYNNLLRLISFNSSVNSHLETHSYDCVLGMDRTEAQTHLRAGGGCHAAWLRRRCAEASMLRCLSFRLNPFHRSTLALERRAFLSPGLRKIICNSHLVRKEIEELYPAVSRKLMVIHNGVEWHEFSEPFIQAGTRRDSIRSYLDLQRGKFYFLFVGSGYERKGLGKTISALSLLPDAAELIVVGKDKKEGQYRDMAKKKGLSQRVHFFGPRKEVIPFYQAADAFVLPTLYDPFSNASLEALAMGLFTVTSDANGCAEVFREGTGAVIPAPCTPGAVAAAMKTALEPHLSGEEIRESVRHLDFENQLKKLVDVCTGDVG